MQEADNPVLDKRLSAFCYLLTFFALLPWAYVRFLAIPNGNILWLGEALRRYLDGDTMTSGFYEPNPPLALFTAAPQLFLSWLTGMSLANCTVIAVTLLVLLSALAVSRIINPWPFLKARDKHAFICIYILASTLLTGPMFGERDHLLALGLVPFVLMQASLTFRLPYNKKLAACVFFIGAWLILLKPHYGLLATVILIYRAIYRRSLSALFAMDFFMLAAATLLYGSGTWLLFPDFVRVILPDSLRFYARTQDFSATYGLALQYLAGGAFVLLMPACKNEHKRFATGLMLCGVIALIPFVLQGRGYYYHLIPAIVFLWLALGLRIHAILASQASSRVAPPGSVIFMMALTWLVANDPLHPTKHEYATLPLVREAAGCGQPHCPFFLFAPRLEMIHEIAYAADAFHASRIPSFWVLPPLLSQQDNLDHGRPANLTQQQIDAYRSRYARMVAEDFMRYQPPLVMLMNVHILKEGAPFDFAGYFSSDADFKKIWQNYHYSGSQTVKIGDYVPGLADADPNEFFKVDIYRRTPQ